ncbi:MAG TPA: hypothetical protein VEZ48_03950, partial [Sphingomonadaceae bacterium]|nr:hypothetical protein [Sphingomonadaceae bacterium]
MVAIFTGAGAGFERGSGAVLGGMGLLGQAALGRSGEQVMLNAANGNLMITQRDEFLVGRGPDAAISRTYNSLGNFSDENGDNWRQSTARKLTWHTGTFGVAGSAVKHHLGDGSEKLYWFDGANYSSNEGDGAYDRLVRHADHWMWSDGGGQITERYSDHQGTYSRLTEQVDASGNRLSFEYVGDHVSRVTTADGGWVQYQWSGANITAIVTGARDLVTGADRQLTRTRYGYDGQNRLTSVTVDLSPEDSSIADGRAYTTSYAYHGDSRLVASVAQTDGSRLEIGYDGQGRVNSLRETVAEGVARTTTVAYGAGSTTITDAGGQATTLEYNPDGALRRIVSPPAAWGAAQQIVQFAYNASGDLVSVTDAGGATTTYTHDARGNVLRETSPLGHPITRTYGARNELLTETRIASGAETNLLKNSSLASGTEGWHLYNSTRVAGPGDPPFVFRQLDASGDSNSSTPMMLAPEASTVKLSYMIKPGAPYQQ